MEGKAKNKTTIQILLEKIDTLEKFTTNISLDYSKNENYFSGYKNSLNAVRKIIDESNLIEKEKQQIMEAYNSGYSEGYLDSDNKGMGFSSPSDYYNEKYGYPQGKSGSEN
ncbi:hypothetical protein OZ664_11785 [Elizabethkingia sp. HX WHF]|uniref:hypothetical protein n=1 Tax=Elizabethkingia sp. HX WHF TaxID=3003190 RepID=UPI002A244D5F|nr:hypothetical protein [Elizabethkingia sp. HX WHF]MDX8564681.1 hypothetical protein [Elizabethkingia sp. HX WHF]